MTILFDIRPGRLVALAALAAVVSMGHGVASDAVLEKVHPRVLSEAATGGEAEFLVVLDEQADLSGIPVGATRGERGREVFERLTEVARRTQAPMIQWLEQRRVPHRSFWIANLIWARADLATITTIAGRAEVRRLDANPRVRLDTPSVSAAPESVKGRGPIEWGILQTKADEVWSLGYDGSGVVIAGQDTGYHWDHPALIDRYRGWNGSSVDHNYNWHDAIHSGGGSCGSDSSEPCDDIDHGTHTMGTMVGDDGGGNQIGMAPGARWMGCRNMDEGDGTPATYTECFQFFVAPTDLDGNNPDPSRAPHVINNSWGCPESEGCDPDTLQTVVENTRAAGIVIVASAGNLGDHCETIEEAPGIYDGVLTVGSTDDSDKIAQDSGRGPVTVDDSNRLKPDVAAPGVDIRSSVPDDGYSSWNGTSMAAPHVTGLVALLLDAREDLAGRVDEVEAVVRLSSEPKTSSKNCGDYPGDEVPNPIYGHGRVDALQAVTGDVDGDGVGNLTDCAPADGTVWSGPDPATGLTVEQAGPVTVLTWTAPVDPGAENWLYDVLSSEQAGDFESPNCLATDAVPTEATDSAVPGTAFFYLVRVENGCGGNLGSTSDGVARSGGDCSSGP